MSNDQGAGVAAAASAEQSKPFNATASLTRLHTWFGLTAGWLLFVIFFTGSLTVFAPEITLWMQPEVSVPSHSELGATPRTLQTAEAFWADKGQSDARAMVRFPDTRNPDLRISFGGRGDIKTYAMDPLTGVQFEPRDTMGAQFFRALHYRLNIDRRSNEIGFWIVGLATAMMLAVLISGVIIHKRIFRELFVFRSRSAYPRAWLDGHTALGVFALPFLFVIGFTGLAYFYFLYMPAGVSALFDGDQAAFRQSMSQSAQGGGGGKREAGAMLPLSTFVEKAEAAMPRSEMASIRITPSKGGASVVEVRGSRDVGIVRDAGRVAFDGASGDIVQPLAAPLPAERLQSFVVGLHLAWFGGYAMHWLYFVLGLVGAGTMATGLVMFTVKRSARIDRASRADRLWWLAVGRINVAVIAGLALASISYLWANRVLAVGLEERAMFEIRIFFVVWVAALLHAYLRGAAMAWREQLGLAALMACSLPVLNWMTMRQWAGTYAADGDWQRFSVELVVVAMGVGAAAAAIKLGNISAAAESTFQRRNVEALT
ncbi:PepSY domain-containing protein [Hyphomicrobium sulfonivorans]|uniref:PepSY domain-containing protein n=1 Tax=Hyphomicrobium sulfonivorans TaxID=121290 RepID=UPI00156FB329|nr:PepSY domain-containing protein [Hyphomicrobium sulfonivorans]